MTLWSPQGVKGGDYISLYPYVHYNFFIDAFVYFGIGTGRMFTLMGSAGRSFSYDLIYDPLAFDLNVGLKIHVVDLQGMFRYDFRGGYYFNVLLGYSFLQSCKPTVCLFTLQKLAYSQNVMCNKNQKLMTYASHSCGGSIVFLRVASS
jgi:hypothetical protein